MLLCITDHRLEGFLCHVRADLGRRDIYFACGRQWLVDPLCDLIELAIGSLHIAIQDIGEEEDAAAGMVKSDDRVGKEVDAIGHSRIERRGSGLLPRSRNAVHMGLQRCLKIANGLVAEIAHQPACEARRVR